MNLMKRVGAALLAALLVMAPLPATRAQEPSLGVVLARAGEYVTEYRRQLSGIVAEEHYTQRATTPVQSRRRLTDTEHEHRELRSDFLLVRPAGEERYTEFRDVFEVDGSPVRDRQERLTRLFLDPSASAARQIDDIRRESARYNIGDVLRTLNTPTLALLILRPAHQPQFTFARATDTSPSLSLGGEAPADVWVIAYTEVERNTMIRGTGGKDLPSEGRFWIEPVAGRVLLSEFIVNDSRVLRATIDVRYGSDPAIGPLVPVEMRERYDDLRDGARVEGTATYSRFRQFQVQVEETSPGRTQ